MRKKNLSRALMGEKPSVKSRDPFANDTTALWEGGLGDPLINGGPGGETHRVPFQVPLGLLRWDLPRTGLDDVPVGALPRGREKLVQLGSV